MTNSKLGRVITIATTVCLILLGIGIIVCCAHLYFTGGNTPYSRESVGQYLLILAVPAVVAIGLSIWGAIYSSVKGEDCDESTKRTQVELLESFSARYDLSSFDEETQAIIRAERKRRLTFKCIAYAFSAAVFASVLVYIIGCADFTVETLNDDVVAALAIVLPFSAIALGIHVPRVYIAESSARVELEAMKAYIKEHGAPKKAEAPEVKKFDYENLVKYALLGVSVVLIVLGIINGGMADVLNKAVKICTECIGLG